MMPNKLKNKIRRIGLTGGIASGKSTVSSYLIENGYTIIDADQISHQISQVGGKLYKNIISSFGEDILTSENEIDRKKLGKIVFENNLKLRELNEISHQLIYEEMINQLKNKEEGSKNSLIFFDIPLLFESFDKAKSLCLDSIWMVSAPYEVRLERIIKRDGLEEDEAKSRIKAQMPQRIKEEMADIILYNDNSLEGLYKKIDQALKLEIKSNENI